MFSGSAPKNLAARKSTIPVTAAAIKALIFSHAVPARAKTYMARPMTTSAPKLTVILAVMGISKKLPIIMAAITANAPLSVRRIRSRTRWATPK